ncbi:hypothetical protein GCM10023229_04690 [Flavisolibacter ginsenosidimutans]
MSGFGLVSFFRVCKRKETADDKEAAKCKNGNEAVSDFFVFGCKFPGDCVGDEEEISGDAKKEITHVSNIQKN